MIIHPAVYIVFLLLIHSSQLLAQQGDGTVMISAGRGLSVATHVDCSVFGLVGMINVGVNVWDGHFNDHASEGGQDALWVVAGYETFSFSMKDCLPGDLFTAVSPTGYDIRMSRVVGDTAFTLHGGFVGVRYRVVPDPHFGACFGVGGVLGHVSDNEFTFTHPDTIAVVRYQGGLQFGPFIDLSLEFSPFGGYIFMSVTTRLEHFPGLPENYGGGFGFLHAILAIAGYL